SQKLTPPSLAREGRAAKQTAAITMVRVVRRKMSLISVSSLRRWRVRIGRAHRDQGMPLGGSLELADHLQHRTDHPAIGDLLVGVFARVCVEVEKERDGQLDRRR